MTDGIISALIGAGIAFMLKLFDYISEREKQVNEKAKKFEEITLGRLQEANKDLEKAEKKLEDTKKESEDFKTRYYENLEKEIEELRNKH